MLVTKIERQKRDPRRVNLFIDGTLAFGLQEEVLLRSGIRKGDQLSEEELGRIQASEEFTLAKREALRLLGYRLRSEAELRTRLLEKEFHPATVDRVSHHLRQLRILDDARFARAYVHDMRLRRALGRIALQQQLRLKGIPQSIIDGVLRDQARAEDEQAVAFEAVSKLLRRYSASRKETPPGQRRSRIFQFLARRGFDRETIAEVMKKLCPEDPS